MTWCALHYCSCLLLLYYCTPLWSAEEGSWITRPTHIPGLVCDSLGFHYTVYQKWNRLISMKLTAFDKQGVAHALSAHYDCGTRIIRRQSGSVALHAFYNGCYVYEENDEHVMTILVEYSPGNWIFSQKKTLKCPKLREKTAMYKAASNRTVLVSFQGPLYFPTAEDTGASGEGSPARHKLLTKKWERIVLVVGVLAALLISICIIKRRCQRLNDKAVYGI